MFIKALFALSSAAVLIAAAPAPVPPPAPSFVAPPAVAADHKDDAKLVSDKLQQDINQELTGQFSAALQQEIPVTRNNELIDKVLSEE